MLRLGQTIREVRREFRLYYLAFRQCSTCRSLGFGIGPIPWSVVMMWCDRYGIGPEDSEDVWHVVSAVDANMLDHWRVMAEAKAKPNTEGR